MINTSIDLFKILSYLSDSKIVPSDVLPTKTTSIITDEVINAINEGCELEYDEMEDDLYIITSTGEKILCPDLSDGLSTSSEWIAGYLPDVFYDIDQGGNVRKSLEAEALYKLISLACVVESYKEEIIDHVKKYDFETMTSNDNAGYNSFVAQLQKFQDLNSVRINSVFSAASIKLSTYREKSESYYTGSLNAEETSKLESLSRNIRSIIAIYEREQGLNPRDMSNMSKISKLQLIDSRDREIEKVVNESDVAMIYKISKLTSERIPAVIKSRVYDEADAAAEKEVKDRNLSGFEAEDLRQEVKRIIVKESFRAIIKSIKQKEIERYKADPASYKLKVKC